MFSTLDPRSAIMRHFMRHPSSMPIEVCALHSSLQAIQHLCNVSVGGLAFASDVEVEAGLIVSLRIPCVSPVFESLGKVAWCRESGDGFELGVEFLDQDDAFRARMIEQVCHIEQYREQVWQTEQRKLSAEEAAAEWIGKYAATFPDDNMFPEGNC